MLIKTLEIMPFGTNCYIVTDETTMKSAVIDPGGESNKILNYLEDNKMTCEAILITHSHMDHVMGFAEVYNETKATTYMSQLDDDVKPMMGYPSFKAPAGTVFVKENDIIKVGNLEIKVIETPGHTPGGLSFLAEDSVFTGDTLFRGSCGRTDFEGGSMPVQLVSLKKLADMPGEYDVYPGHMESTRMSIERHNNPYIAMAIKHLK